MKKILTLALTAVALVVAGTCSAESISPDKIKEKAKTCAACHGDDGNAAASPLYPRLAGQYHDYLARALHEYKSGERKNAIMSGFVSTLSDAEIQGLADYYGALPGKLDDLSRYQQGN